MDEREGVDKVNKRGEREKREDVNGEQRRRKRGGGGEGVGMVGCREEIVRKIS